MKKVWLFTLVLVISLVGLTACGSQNVTIDMDMQEYVFIPDSFVVPAGAEVTINLSNSGTLEHEMVVMVFGTEATVPFDDNDEENIYWERELEAGARDSVTFTVPSEPGEYQIVCGIPAHIELGMVGTMIVK